MNIYALVWSVTAAIGALLSIALIVEAVLDLRSLGVMSNGRRIRARARLASESIRLVTHLAFLAIGLAALGTPAGPLSWTIVVLIGGNVGLIANSIIALYVSRLEPSKATRAEAAATDLIATAERAARQIVQVAEQAAAELKRVELEQALNRNAEAAERTAHNTEQIAKNTDPNGK